MRVTSQGAIASWVWRNSGALWGSAGTWPRPELPARPPGPVRGWASGQRVPTGCHALCLTLPRAALSSLVTSKGFSTNDRLHKGVSHLERFDHMDQGPLGQRGAADPGFQPRATQPSFVRRGPQARHLLSCDGSKTPQRGVPLDAPPPPTPGWRASKSPLCRGFWIPEAPGGTHRAWTSQVPWAGCPLRGRGRRGSGGTPKVLLG